MQDSPAVLTGPISCCHPARLWLTCHLHNPPSDPASPSYCFHVRVLVLFWLRICSLPDLICFYSSAVVSYYTVRRMPTSIHLLIPCFRCSADPVQTSKLTLSFCKTVCISWFLLNSIIKSIIKSPVVSVVLCWVQTTPATNNQWI